MNNILLIANPGSGRGLAEDYAIRLGRLLRRAYQAKVQIYLTEKAGDAYHFAAKAHENQFDTVICLGGDGTVNETVNGIFENDELPTFGFLPLGTVNDYGRVLGFSMDPEEAIQQFKHVEIIQSDIAQINDQKFINVVAIGTISESVMKTDSQDKNRLGVLAYLKDGIPAFFQQKGLPLTITNDEGLPKDIFSSLILIGSTNSIAGIEDMVPNARYDDGLLHLIAVKGDTPLDMIRAALAGGDRTAESDSLYIASSASFNIEVQKAYLSEIDEVLTNVDGDEGPALPIQLKILPQALNVIKPK
ncbi:diacylglycerol/lipid kinase family protein [Fundicoccus culcitae]|uniref:Diacylglycerol kinase family lipid kinase n=1 Tax=Fundicoccus culcitae TaxID=2969821 RepID=A0ABY5P7G4_9LACT|nr:diacylglycerol kinase family protein [Fundicoccus culcitae]UUX34320.1 diacylglycerol kinase family lipid kinase [Fundicoccus culcitae]